MRFGRKAILALASLGAAFLAGYWLHQPAPAARAGTRQPLYYRDPMHPSYRSNKPGIAPDCGMELEPVYANGATTPGGAGSSMPPGAVRISLDKQQIMGLRTTAATRGTGSHTLRVLGRVTADETRVYRITSQVEGIVRSVSAFSAGSQVRKDDLLAAYFVSAREVYNAIQSYFVAINAMDQGFSTNPGAVGVDTGKAQVRAAEEMLQQYGLTQKQLQEMMRTREITRDIEFRSPIQGVVLSRNVSLGQRLDRNTEIFRIADLTRVWVLADLFEGDAALLRPGAPARVLYRGKSLRAASGSALPQFDPASRTLKLRLELDNPDLQLRPDMFVDVEFDVKDPEGISVPVDSVLDSGRRKVVFVSGGGGMFEPREVTTGPRFGDRVQIATGVREGEQVVVSGLFLLDSESRLQLGAATALKPPPSDGGGATDPVCGMPLDPRDGKQESSYQGATYRFCSASCKAKFDRNPSLYAKKPAQPAGAGQP